jgi:hypothetical protein
LIPLAKALALATPTRSLNQSTRSNPLAIRLRNSSSGRSDQPNPARRTKKNRSAFT